MLYVIVNLYQHPILIQWMLCLYVELNRMVTASNKHL